MVTLEIASSYDETGKVGVMSRLHGKCTVKQTVDLIAAVIQAAMTLAEQVDHDIDGKGLVNAEISRRLEAYNQDPQGSGVRDNHGGGGCWTSHQHHRNQSRLYQPRH